MTSRHLSPAQRTMLRNALTGAPLHQGLTSAAQHAGGGTRAALVKRGLLNDTNDQPTSQGYAVFAPTQQPLQVWFLVGPQACGKTRWAMQAVSVLALMGCSSTWMDTHTFEREYSGVPELTKDIYPELSVLMLENNNTRGSMPRHSMKADRVIDLTDFLSARRPEMHIVATQLRVTFPAWTEDKVLTTAKAIVTRRVAP